MSCPRWPRRRHVSRAGGWPWLVWGFCLPTMTLAHATFAINTINHMFQVAGSRRDALRATTSSRRSSLRAEGWQ